MLTPDERRKADRMWGRITASVHKPKISKFEFYVLYNWFLNACKRYGVDPETIDFEALIDPQISYDENKSRLVKELEPYSTSYIEEKAEEVLTPERLESMGKEEVRDFLRRLMENEAVSLSKMFDYYEKEFRERETGGRGFKPEKAKPAPKPEAKPINTKETHGICAYCGKPIYYGQDWTTYEGKTYHYKCYKEMMSKKAPEYYEALTRPENISILVNRGIKALARKVNLPPLDLYAVLRGLIAKYMKYVPLPREVIPFSPRDVAEAMLDHGIKGAAWVLSKEISDPSKIRKYLSDMFAMLLSKSGQYGIP